MIIIVLILATRARTGQFALTMARLVTQWINAISCMVFHQGLCSRISLLWLIKSLQNSCPLLLQCIIRILPLHLNSVNSFLPCLVLQVHLLQYHLKSKKLPWPMQLLLPVLPVCQCQVLIFPHVFSAQVINRRAYDKCTWVLDTRVTDHFVCLVDLLTSITATMQSLVQLQNGEST